MALETYNEKRDFARTPEPPGKKEDTGDKLRFVVQLHDASRRHYDFRLEWEGVLLSWAVPKGPSYNPKEKRLAVHVEDHPLDYRTFEGTIPKGEYGGGTVMVWDEGSWEPTEDFAAGLKSGALKFALQGTRLQGKWALIRMKPKEGEEADNWLLIKEKDEYVQDETGIEAYDTSVVSGRSMEEIARGPESGKLPFTTSGVMLAKLSAKAPGGDDWLHEIKFDGYRMLAYIEDGEARLITRGGHDWTDKFPTLVAALTEWQPGNVVVDGELVVLTEEGRSDFQALQSALKKPGTPIYYILFDLLAVGEQDLRQEPLISRKERLEELVELAPESILYSPHQVGHGSQVFAQACADKQEGILSKRSNSKYVPGRGDSWLKVKCDQRQEFVIGGYTTTEKSTSGLSALLLGVYEDGELTYVGRAGTGFTVDSAADLLKKFKRLERKTSPFSQELEERSDETITYVRPSLLAEVKFAEITDEGLLRHASFKGLRGDKPAKTVTLEKPEVPVYEDIQLSSPDKLIYPDDGISKQDVADYYWSIRERILPYIKDRPMTLIRCSDGIGGECFYQKHMNQTIPGMDTFKFKENDGEPSEAMVIRDEAGLMGAVQMGAVEFHPWGSVVAQLEQPDLMVFDLDPDEGMDIAQVRQGVKDLKDLLDETGLTSYLKSSGGKGYHVVVPLKSNADWPQVRDFAKLIAHTMETKWPERYTANMRKAKRKGRIYVDWVRNGRGATSVANFSLRSRPGAAIAWPLRWSDLDRVQPNEVTWQNHRAYEKTLSGWEDFSSQEQKLN